MTRPLPFPKGSLLFAPMEGVTDEAYRRMLYKYFGEWDYYFCDFLRVPSEGQYPVKKIRTHYGESVLKSPKWRGRTGYQILASKNSNLQSTLEQMKKLDIRHLDLNLGCPSKKVNAHGGGAYLLSNLPELKRILRTIRAEFEGTFTAKIRIGYRDDKHFDDLLKLFEDEGVEAITIHGRLRDQLYKGQANWEYIKRAVQKSRVPIIGNGDLWTIQDIQRMFEECGCYAIMCGRGALKTPWLARLYKEGTTSLWENENYLLQERKENIPFYFAALTREYKDIGQGKESFLLSRFKGLSRYLFEDFEKGPELRTRLLRSQTLPEFESHLEKLPKYH